MYTSSIYCIIEPIKLRWHAMSKLIKDPSKIAWDQFFTSGYLLEDPASHTIWGGYGQSDSSALTFFHTPFFKKNQNFHQPKECFCLKTKEFWEAITDFCLNDLELESDESIDESFLKQVSILIQDIKQAKFQKIVPVTYMSYKYSGRPELSLMKFKDLEGHLYGFWNQTGGIIGSSPEILFRRENDTDHFVALAGTISKNQSDAEAKLLNSEKDIHEHQLVISDIEKKLATIGKAQLEKSATKTSTFGPLLHLKTKLSSPSMAHSSGDLVKALHPTAALCGYPEEVAIERLKHQKHFELDGEERLFGGIFGVEYKDFALSIVMIRNIQWSKEKLIINSGCGVVSSSIPENELEEVQTKRKAIEERLR